MVKKTQPTMYILEVGYEKTYHQTYKKHLQLVREFQHSLHFKNTWRQTISRKIKEVRDFILAHSVLAVGYVGLFSYGLGPAVYSMLVASGIIRYAIPISPATEFKDGILFIPADGRQFHPRKGDAETPNTSEVRIHIPVDKFDSLIDDIADTYGGTRIQKELKTIDGVHPIMYGFSADTPNVETKIKRFLFSLPINVVVRHIYKLEGKSQNTDEKTLIFPRLQKLKSKTIPETSLSRQDIKIIEYGDINVRIYNKNNKNVVYLLEYVKPLKYIQNLFPEEYRIPEYSPFKNKKE